MSSYGKVQAGYRLKAELQAALDLLLLWLCLMYNRVDENK